MNIKLLFSVAHFVAHFSTTGILIAAGLSGQSELAANVAIAQGASLALFLGFSANARSLILKSTAEARSMLLARIALMVPLTLAVVYLSTYVGRMNKEKGVPDLLAAFGQLRADFTDLHLILVGPDEEGLLTKSTIPGLHVIGYTKNAEAYMSAADIICLPSYREGFGSVLIEGAACGLPAVASRIYGVTDAVVENVTGLLHAPGEVADLTNALRCLLSNGELRLALADKASERALAYFEARHIEWLFSQFLEHLLEEKASSSKSGASGLRNV